jgi:CheY-like chemotaxis protein
MISVSDTGTGMSPETLAQAFEPFFTTKPAGQGTGLGLSMVYGFAKQSRGHVQIYSEVGQGTSVRLYLPRAGGVATVDAVAMPERAAPARPGERILAVEDNPDVRATVTQQLAALGYGVVAAENAEEAIKILMRGDAVDLLFSDVVMPGGMTGYELARAARALRPGLKVLLTSGFHAHLLSSREHGEIAEPLLIKPYRKVELAAKVRSVLDA